MKTKTAMILAAGYGKRLKPITNNIPKPLIKIYNKSLLGYAIDTLFDIGIKNIIINTHYKAELINKYLEKNYKNSEIYISYEKNILDTGGGFKNASKFLKEDLLLIINSDTFWNSEIKKDLKNFLYDNKINNNNCSLLLSNIKNSFGIDKSYGDFIVKKDLIYRNFNHNEGLIYLGAQIIRKSILKHFTEKKFSFNEIWDFLIKEKKLTGVSIDTNWLHLGNINSFDFVDKFKP